MKTMNYTFALQYIMQNVCRYAIRCHECNRYSLHVQKSKKQHKKRRLDARENRWMRSAVKPLRPTILRNNLLLLALLRCHDSILSLMWPNSTETFANSQHKVTHFWLHQSLLLFLDNPIYQTKKFKRSADCTISSPLSSFSLREILQEMHGIRNSHRFQLENTAIKYGLHVPFSFTFFVVWNI